MIERNCNVNHIDNFGQNALFYACWEGSSESIMELKKHNIDINLWD